MASLRWPSPDRPLSATPAERTALAAQLTWTLQQIADVSGVQVNVNGQPLRFRISSSR